MQNIPVWWNNTSETKYMPKRGENIIRLKIRSWSEKSPIETKCALLRKCTPKCTPNVWSDFFFLQNVVAGGSRSEWAFQGRRGVEVEPHKHPEGHHRWGHAAGPTIPWSLWTEDNVRIYLYPFIWCNVNPCLNISTSFFKIVLKIVITFMLIRFGTNKSYRFYLERHNPDYTWFRHLKCVNN